MDHIGQRVAGHIGCPREGDALEIGIGHLKTLGGVAHQGVGDAVAGGPERERRIVAKAADAEVVASVGFQRCEDIVMGIHACGSGPGVGVGRFDSHIKSGGRTNPRNGDGGGTNIDIGDGGTSAGLGAVDHNTVEQNALAKTGMRHKGDLVGGRGIGEHDCVGLPHRNVAIPRGHIVPSGVGVGAVEHCEGILVGAPCGLCMIESHHHLVVGRDVENRSDEIGGVAVVTITGETGIVVASGSTRDATVSVTATTGGPSHRAAREILIPAGNAVFEVLHPREVGDHIVASGEAGGMGGEASVVGATDRTDIDVVGGGGSQTGDDSVAGGDSGGSAHSGRESTHAIFHNPVGSGTVSPVDIDAGSGEGCGNEAVGSGAGEQCEADIVDGSGRIGAHGAIVGPDNGEVVVAGRHTHRVLFILPSVAEVLLSAVDSNPTGGQGVAVAVDGGERSSEIVAFGDKGKTHEVVAAFTLATPVVGDGGGAVVRHLEVDHGERDGLVAIGISVACTIVVGDIHAVVAAVVDSGAGEPGIGAGALIDGEGIGGIFKVVEVGQEMGVGTKGGNGGGGGVAEDAGTIGIDPNIIDSQTAEAGGRIVGAGDGVDNHGRSGVAAGADADHIAATGGGVGP